MNCSGQTEFISPKMLNETEVIFFSHVRSLNSNLCRNIFVHWGLGTTVPTISDARLISYHLIKSDKVSSENSVRYLCDALIFNRIYAKQRAFHTHCISPWHNMFLFAPTSKEVKSDTGVIIAAKLVIQNRHTILGVAFTRTLDRVDLRLFSWHCHFALFVFNIH